MNVENRLDSIKRTRYKIMISAITTMVGMWTCILIGNNYIKDVNGNHLWRDAWYLYQIYVILYIIGAGLFVVGLIMIFLQTFNLITIESRLNILIKIHNEQNVKQTVTTVQRAYNMGDIGPEIVIPMTNND